MALNVKTFCLLVLVDVYEELVVFIFSGFITAFTRDRHWKLTQARWISLFSIYFNIIPV